MRPDFSPVTGPATGWTIGERHGLEPRVALRWSRGTAFGPDTRLGELATSTSVFAALGPLRLHTGLGFALRRYTTARQAVATHLITQNVSGLGLHLGTPRWDLELDGVIEYDVTRTHAGWFEPDERLFPAALRLELRFAPSFEPRHRSSTSEREPREGGEP
jgi:hypothetical protein